MSGFPDIKVIGIVKDKTRKLNEFHYDVQFVLSAAPPEEWVRMFEAHTSLDLDTTAFST